jgi:hypothetical protein
MVMTLAPSPQFRKVAPATLRLGEVASWGPTFRIIRSSPHKSGQMRAFLTAQTPSGMIIPDLRLMRANDGRWWIGLPNRPVLDSEGRHLVVDGKKAYAPTIDFVDRATRDRFTAGVLRAVQQRWPRGFDDEPSSELPLEIAP